MDRSGYREACPVDDLGGQGHRGIGRLGTGHRGFQAQPQVAAVEAHLVDGLGCTAPPQFGRTIGGEHQQRYPGVERLDHRG